MQILNMNTKNDAQSALSTTSDRKRKLSKMLKQKQVPYPTIQGGGSAPRGIPTNTHGRLSSQHAKFCLDRFSRSQYIVYVAVI